MSKPTVYIKGYNSNNQSEFYELLEDATKETRGCVFLTDMDDKDNFQDTIDTQADNYNADKSVTAVTPKGVSNALNDFVKTETFKNKVVDIAEKETGIITVERGGTGASNAKDAREKLGIVEGVNIGGTGTTLYPDKETRIITLPMATTSAPGLMSATQVSDLNKSFKGSFGNTETVAMTNTNSNVTASVVNNSIAPKHLNKDSGIVKVGSGLDKETSLDSSYAIYIQV